MQRADVKAALAREGTEVVLSKSPEEFAAFLVEDGRFWVKLVKDAGVKPGVEERHAADERRVRPGLPAAVPAITGQKYSARTWRDETDRAAAVTQVAPTTRRPSPGINSTRRAVRGRRVAGVTWVRWQRRSSDRAMSHRITSGP